MQDLNLLNLSISEISKLLDQKKISSLELTMEVFGCVKKVEPKVKAFITLCEKEAMGQAKDSDKQHVTSNMRRSKIDGVPISIKDVICTKNIKTTAGSKMLADFIPAYDATVVERLKNAGAVIIGKNNCDAWAHGASTENSDFFPTHNPWDLERVPGGSSGGSAAAVTAGMGFASIGTDTGGSVRQPAGFCGVTGLKPTYGRNSRYGIIAMASSLDCPGPITKTAEDAGIIQEIIAGHDIKDSTTVPNKKFQISNSKCQINSKCQMSNVKIGIPEEYFSKGLDPKIEKSVMEAVGVLEKAGAKVKRISLPHTEYAVAVYYIIQPAEVSSNLARYDGIRFGYSAEKNSNVLKLNHLKLNKNLTHSTSSGQEFKIKNLSDLYLINRAEGFGDEVKRRIMLGTYVLSAGYFDAYYKKAMKVRTLIKHDFEKAFKDIDIIVTPTSPTLPFKIGQNSSDPLSMYLADVYTCATNIAGIPAVSIPVKQVNGLPVGIQILGPQFGEEEILAVANYYQHLTNLHKQMPEL